MALVKYNNNSISAVTAAAAIPSGAMTLIKTLTASSSATLSFVHGTSDVVLDSTYPIYVFKFYNIHPSNTSDPEFQVNFRDGSTAYDAIKTTTFFYTYHGEDGSSGELSYAAAADLAQSTEPQRIASDVQGDNDSSTSGTLYLYNPSSTTFVKHFMSTSSVSHGQPAAFSAYVAGYCNVTAAIDGVQFSFSAGNIDSGVIKLFGIKDS